MADPLQILIADDNPDDRLLAVRQVEREFPGAEIREALDAAGLQRALDEGAIDLVITEYALQWSDGLAVLRAARERDADVAVVMFTDSGNEEVAAEAMKAGLDEYVPKSAARPGRLGMAARAALDRARHRRALRAAEAERKRLEAELRRRVEELAERDRLKDQFLAVLGHELRNPLGAVSNALHVLEREGAGEDRAARTRAIALRQVARLSRLLDELLDVGRITRGRIELRRAPVELAALLGEVVDIARPKAEASNHQFSVSLPPAPLTVQGDAVRLQQVFDNLLDNAITYTPSGGRIGLSLERDGAEAVVRVTDNGAGIAREALPQLFDLFRQVSRSITQTVGGLGIGLYLVQSLVERHGGRVEVHSPGLGQGSEFTVRLPLAS